jgi:hypothetical protein
MEGKRRTRTEQGRCSVAGFCEHGNETSAAIKINFFASWATVSFSRKTLHSEVVVRHILLIIQ